jgi:hypothetical protein
MGVALHESHIWKYGAMDSGTKRKGLAEIAACDVVKTPNRLALVLHEAGAWTRIPDCC